MADVPRVSASLWNPSRSVADDEPFVQVIRRRVGGPIGRFARRRGPAFAATPWAILAASITWMILLLRQFPCQPNSNGQTPNTFFRLCYSDISVLYQTRGLGQGTSPFGLEYPVLTGMLIQITRGIAQLFGAVVSPGATSMQIVRGSMIFFAVTVVLLYVCYVVTVIAHAATMRTRPFDAVMVGAAPVVLGGGLINWDMFCVALTALGILAWSRRHPFLAGVLIGIATAAKLYPVLLLVPLLALCLRAGKFREFTATTFGTLLGWLLPNLTLMILAPADWAFFFQFNAARGIDLGSIWYVLSLMGLTISGVNVVQAILLIAGAVGVIMIVFLAPRRPRLGQVAFLIVVWFLMINKVYSPQYVVWLLPFVVLAVPRWRDFLIWSVGELVYYLAVWGHLSGTMYAAGSNQDKLYWLSVFIRIGVQLYLVVRVCQQIWHPEADVVRRDGGDDPAGGPLDGAADDSIYLGLMGRLGESDAGTERPDADAERPDGERPDAEDLAATSVAPVSRE